MSGRPDLLLSYRQILVICLENNYQEEKHVFKCSFM